jgi:predicted thioesterase
MTFKTACYDEAGLIGEGTHMRAIVDLVRFEAKAEAKKAK